ncbi:MAG: tRNA (adenosine(37)-N6)-threonylcarbamoyltransferase complex dimerization subunit type 1 TsaB [Myxococcaceae bacterium]
MILALDTSTSTLSLALVHEGRVVREEAHGPPKRQSDLLPGAIDSLLESENTRLTALETIVVGLGPGSFTGLRLGLATAKGLAYAAEVPLVGASSLEALALEGPEGRLLIAAAHARKGEVYAAAYRRDGAKLASEWPARPLSHAQLVEILRGADRPLALGPAISSDREALLQLGAPQEALADGPAFPSAARLVERAALPAAFDLQKLFALEPEYVGVSGAERNASASGVYPRES